MSFSIYWGPGLLIPVALSIFLGFTGSRAREILGYIKKDTPWERLLLSLPAILLFTFWSMANIPLPIVYVLAILCKLIRLLYKGNNRTRELFLINITHLTTMALHMILLSVISLITDTSISIVLEDPFWRIGMIGAILIVNNVTAWIIPQWDMVLSVLRTQSKSEEVRPFMVFLWFCNVFLLLDSILCAYETGWNLLPQFIITSTVLLEIYLIRFLSHLYNILKVHYLEDEHGQLMDELEKQNTAAAELRCKTTLDPLTGAFSRRYLIEQAQFLLEKRISFSFVFIDLDHLKQINDREGHHAGDIYLIQFAEKFRLCLRKSDIFARVGGDEFVVLLPDCSFDMASERMTAIRSYLTDSTGKPLAFSYGITYSSAGPGENIEAIFHRADQAMYEDKQKRTR